MGFFRLFLAMSVVLGHAPLPGLSLFPDAQCAVILFFIISGFYMSLVINKKYSLEPNWRHRFYLNRFLRIYPVYYVVLLLSILVTWAFALPNVFMNPDPHLTFARRLSYITLNLTIIGQDVVSAFVPDFHQFANHPISIAWTLGTEMLFYLIAPFIVLVKSKKCRMIALYMLILSLTLRVLIIWFPKQISTYLSPLVGSSIAGLLVKSDPGRYRLFPVTVVFFLIGYFSYLLFYERVRSKADRLRIGTSSYLAIVIGFTVVFSIFGEPIFRGVDKDNSIMWLTYLGLFAAMPVIFMATQHLRIDKFLGDLSYPVYIGHNLCLGLVYVYFGLIPGQGTRPHYFSEYGVALTIVLALTLLFLVDRPMMKFRRRIGGLIADDSKTPQLESSNKSLVLALGSNPGGEHQVKSGHLLPWRNLSKGGWALAEGSVIPKNLQPTIDEVRDWDTNPLFSGEGLHEAGSREWFDEGERVLNEDVYLGPGPEPIFTESLHRDSRILDAGCGHGFWVRYFLRHGYTKVSGCDLSPRSVDLARASLEAFGLPTDVDFCSASVEELPYEAGLFDHVNCQGVLHHTPHPEWAFQEFHRVLKPGGTLCFSVYFKVFILGHPKLLELLSPLASLFWKPEGRGRESRFRAGGAEEIVRMYDGAANLPGRAFSLDEIRSMMGHLFQIKKVMRHTFPVRGINLPIPKDVHRWLARSHGLMVVLSCERR
ncbi:MAG: methyltransferase domain-containing protein [Desulfobaccales bacterium]